MAHAIDKEDNKRRMAKYDPENAYAWNIILNEVRTLASQGLRQQEIAKKMGVKQDSISRWLKQERGGERTTFGAMLRYAKALNIPFEKLTKEKSAGGMASPYNKALASALESCTQENEYTITDVAKKANMPPALLNEIFSGETTISAELLHKVCKAIGVKATMVLNRAEKLIEKDNTAKADRSA